MTTPENTNPLEPNAAPPQDGSAAPDPGTPPPLPGPADATAPSAEPATTANPTSAAPATSAAATANASADTPPKSPGPLPPYSPSGRVVDPTATSDQKTYCMFMHLSLLLAIFMPVVSLIAPLIMWQVKKHESPFIDDHGKETLNFHISVLLYGFPGLTLTVTGLLACIGIPLLTFAYVLGIVGLILASLAAQRGEYYRYPMCIRMIR